MASENPGVVSDTFGKQPSLNKKDLVKPTVKPGIKNITVRNTVSKDSLKNR